MATEVGSAYVTLIPSAKGFASKMQRELAGDVSRAGRAAGDDYGDSFSREAGSSISGKGKSMFGSVAKMAGAALAGAGIGRFIGGAISEARDAAVIGARTSQVIKTMGNASNISADQVGKLAENLSNKAAMDDEAIQAGANLLLTFGNVRNEAGKGNKIFSQTTGLMVDMSAAMGTDVKGAALQLGKALNDPTKGVSALTRSGVSFTEQQKEQIKALQESGNMMGAQKVILGEVKKQFGGAAETMATPADRAKVAWGNFQESVGTVILPVVDKLLNKAAEFLPKAAEFASALTAKVGPAFTSAANAGKALFGFLRDNTTTVKVIAGVMLALALAVGAHSLALAINSGALKAWFIQTKIVQAATKTWAAIQWLLNAALSANPIGLIVLAVAALVAGLVIAWKKSETFRAVVTGAFNAVKAAASAVFGWLRGAASAVIDAVRRAWNKLGDVLGGAVRDARQAVVNAWTTVKNATTGAWDAIKSAVTEKVGNVVAEVKEIGGRVLGPIINAWQAVRTATTNAWDGLKTAVAAKITAVVNDVKAIKTKVLGAFSAAGTWLKDVGRNIIEGLGAGIESMYQWVRDKVDALSGWIPGWVKDKLGIASPSKVMKKLGEWIGKGLADGITGGTADVTESLKGLNKAINDRLDAAFDGKKLKAKTKEVQSALKKRVSNLRDHAAKVTELAGKLAAAQETLEKVSSYAGPIKDAVVAMGDLVSLGSREITTGEGDDQQTTTQITAASILEDLRAQAAEAAEFQSIMAGLRSSGLNQTTLDQLYQAGPEAALATAQALSAGGAAAIGEVNALTTQLSATAVTVADNAAESMYGIGLTSAQNIVSGFVADQATLDAQAANLVRQMVAAVEKATDEAGIDMNVSVDANKPKKKRKKGKGTKLASGGRVTGATVALIGEGREAETVLPDSLLRGLLERTAASAAGAGGGVSSVRVFIGDRELTDLVRYEVDGAQVTQARQLAYGRSA